MSRALLRVHVAGAVRLPPAAALAELADEVLVLLDVVRLEADAVEVVPQLALVALHPVDLHNKGQWF